MNIPFYENKIPSVNENVLVIFTEYKSTHIEANLVEYKMLSGMMTYGDINRQSPSCSLLRVHTRPASFVF